MMYSFHVQILLLPHLHTIVTRGLRQRFHDNFAKLAQAISEAGSVRGDDWPFHEVPEAHDVR